MEELQSMVRTKSKKRPQMKDVLIADYGRQAHVIYCDDVRTEIGGKVIFVGVYSTHMFVPKLPMQLPSLVIAIRVSAQITEPFGSLKFRVTFAGEELAALEIPREHIERIFESGKTKLDADFDWIDKNDPSDVGNLPIVGIETQLVISPFKIEREGVLRTLVTVDDERVRAPSLVIRKRDFMQQFVPHQAGQN